MTVVSAHTTAGEAEGVVGELSAQLAQQVPDPAFVAFFGAHGFDGGDLADGLAKRFPTAQVVGCSTAGEFTQAAHSVNGVSAIALAREVVSTVATAMADLGDGVVPGVAGAVADLERQLGKPLRELNPDRFIGLVLIDGLNGNEEAVNVELGQAAPFLSFIGGSAGDNLEFASTWVAMSGRGALPAGAVLAVLELTVPFAVLKTSSCQPAGRSFTVTRSDPATRTLYELDGRPVLEVYCEQVGVAKDALDDQVFMANPFGVMIDGQPWIRSPMRVVEDGGLQLYCQLPEGSWVHIMRTTDLVKDTADAVASLRKRLAESSGSEQIKGAVLFNCILRRLELDKLDRHEEFLGIFEGIPAAGFHTYGESWIGHMNQTCTGLLLG